MTPGLGFVHTGHDQSFVYDIADLYKAQYTIPVAFEIAQSAKEGDDIGKIARLRLRDEFVDGKIMELIVRDIHYLMEVEADESIEIDNLSLWDDKEKLVKNGVNYFQGDE